MTFDNYEFKKYIVNAIKDLGFKELSAIQKLVLDNVRSDKNITRYKSHKRRVRRYAPSKARI